MAERKNRLQGYLAKVGLALAVWVGVNPSAWAQEITIGTGGQTGVYFPAGQAICNAMNKHQAEHGIACTALSTAGSVENVNKVRLGTFDFGIVQSDVQYYALMGYGPFKALGPFSKLRSVLSLHPEIFTVVARADAAIRSFDDLKGKRVNVGNLGSGQRTSMDLLLHAKGWTLADFAVALELPSQQQAQALCDNQVDAIVFTAGHPNTSIKDAMAACDTVLVDVTGQAVERLIDTYPYFSTAFIPANTYKGAERRMRSFGVHATLVTSADTPDPVVHALVQSVFDDLVDFKFSHPAFISLVPNDMTRTGLTAPLHAGAEGYYKSVGDLSDKLTVRPARRH